MIKSTLIEYLRQQIKQSKEDWNSHDSYCIEITPDQAHLIVRELGQSLPIDSVSKNEAICNCANEYWKEDEGGDWYCTIHDKQA